MLNAYIIVGLIWLFILFFKMNDKIPASQAIIGAAMRGVIWPLSMLAELFVWLTERRKSPLQRLMDRYAP